MTTRINKTTSPLQLMKICGLCALAGAALTLLLLLAFAIVSFSNINDPDSYLNVFAIVAASAGALAAGFASCKLYRSKGLLCGALSGVMMLVLLFIFSKLLAGEAQNTSFAPAFPIISICLLVFGSAGGILCANLKRKPSPMRTKAPRVLVPKR